MVAARVVETFTWKYTIHFGSPVPQHYLGSPPDMQAIGTHLLQEFSKVITRHPEQCNMRLLRAMFPLPESGVADVSPSFTQPKVVDKRPYNATANVSG